MRALMRYTYTTHTYIHKKFQCLTPKFIRLHFSFRALLFRSATRNFFLLQTHPIPNSHDSIFESITFFFGAVGCFIRICRYAKITNTLFILPRLMFIFIHIRNSGYAQWLCKRDGVIFIHFLRWKKKWESNEER